MSASLLITGDYPNIKNTFSALRTSSKGVLFSLYMSSQNEQDEIKKYKDAVWSFIIEHCDVLDSGKIFVKFHIDNRRNFENRVWARYRYNYHREDWENKYAIQMRSRDMFILKKKEKHDKYVTKKQERRAELLKRSIMVEWTNWYTKTQEGGILERLIGYIASKTWKRKP